MGTQILRPQDFLTERIRVSPAAFPRRKNCNYGNSYSNSRTNPRPNRKQPQPQPQQQQQPHQPSVRFEKPEQRKRASSEPAISKRSSSDDLRSSRSGSEDLRKSGLLMEKITILRRGESLDSKIRNDVPSKKEMVPKPVQVDIRSPVAGQGDIYAGSAFAVSPEPSSLPLPSFSKKKHVPIDDSATRDLRRLLRLD